ncbi:THAP domain-containing protein 9 [Plakobranchus ocellatus]|uniref:THAP domain-containing protein 9 n=1 Tax=Plakobranchus ocellatus TaxID=259542 RepID=A0AAV4ACB8_9GAST|nr:THAP domain-containing protein 9 [Plakobranchus ocellatus]
MCPQIDAFLKWRSRRKGVGGVGIRADTDGQAGIQKDSLTGKHTELPTFELNDEEPRALKPKVSHHLALGVQATKSPSVRVCAAEAATTATPPSSANQPVSPQPDPGPSTHQVTKDHGYCLSSPRKMKRKIDALAGYAESYKKKIKNVQQQSRRLAIKVANLSEIVQDLKNKNYVSDSCAESLEQSFSGVPLQLMKRILQKKGQGSFHPSLKAFAITLQFYSTKAYNFVRDTFGLGLPAVSTLRG